MPAVPGAEALSAPGDSSEADIGESWVETLNADAQCLATLFRK